METSNINFRKKIDKFENEVTRIKYAFDKRGFSPMAYSKAYDVDRSALTKVLSGELTGEKTTPRSGAVRKIIAQLKSDKIWIGKLPWEK
jgi:predicted transcriptional regulator